MAVCASAHRHVPRAWSISKILVLSACVRHWRLFFTLSREKSVCFMAVSVRHGLRSRWLPFLPRDDKSMWFDSARRPVARRPTKRERDQNKAFQSADRKKIKETQKKGEKT